MNKSLRILVVEDEPTTVMMITEILEQAGHTVCGDAADYTSAINLMKRELPDLAIIDIGLKGQLDGIVTAQELIRIKPIPLIYLTVHKDQETYLRAKQTSPVCFMNKPLQYWHLPIQVDLAWHNYHLIEKQKANQVSAPDYLYLPDSIEKDLGDGLKRVHSKFRVRIESIIWLQAHAAYAALYMTQEELGRLKKRENPIVISINLGSVLDYLPDHFYRLSSSIAINLNHLDRIESRQIIMDGYTREIDIPEGEQQHLLNRLNVVRTRQRR